MKNIINVMFFGDSICTGQHIAIHEGWVTRTSAKLEQLGKQHSTEIIVTNTSVNGRTTRQALESIQYEVQSQHPDVIIIQFGMNDCNYWDTDKGLPRVSRQAFKENLREIITRAANFGASRIFLNTNHPSTLTTNVFPHTNITYQESNKTYNMEIRNLSKEMDVILNDVEYYFQDYINNKSGQLDNLLLHSDQLHLSKKGHDLYLEFIYPRIENVVRELLDE